jgi:hypothetical protein
MAKRNEDSSAHRQSGDEGELERLKALAENPVLRPIIIESLWSVLYEKRGPGHPLRSTLLTVEKASIEIDWVKWIWKRQYKAWRLTGPSMWDIVVRRYRRFGFPLTEDELRDERD